MRKQVYINSADPYISGGTNENFVITGGYFPKAPKAVRLISACIPYSWNNITQGYELKVTEEDTHDLIIPPGNYNATGLATTVQDALNSIGGHTYTVTFSRQRYTISADGDFSLEFSPGLAFRMGFDESTGTGDSFTSPHLAQLISDTELFICSTLINGIDNGAIWLKDGQPSNDRILAVVPINTCFGGIIHYTAPDLTPFDIKNSDFVRTRTAGFSLRFPSGGQPDLQGVPWSMILEFTI